MKPRLKSSRAARDLIKAHEAFLPEAAPRGRRWAVGFGHTAAARPGQTISRDDAELLLIYDVIQAESAVDTAVGTSLPGPVRDALVSFACSIGTGAFKVSDVARLARDGRHLEAAAALETWVRAEEDGRLVVSERLVRRRAAEKALYLQGLADKPAPAAPAEPAPAPEPEKPAPAPKLGPLVDLELEFVDPPEPAGMVPEPAPAAEAPQDAAPEPEPESGPVAEPEVQTEPDAAEAPSPAQAEPQGDDATRTVMARMAAHMSETLSVDAPAEGDVTAPSEPEPAPEPDPVPTGTRLGFSFLTPVKAGVEPAQAPAPVSAPAEPAEASRPAQPAPLVSAGPVPVYAGVTISSGINPAIEAGSVIRPDGGETIRSDSPAAATGFSGEVQAVGRPDDIEPEEDDQADTEELHPGVLTGAAPEPEPAAAPPVAPPARKPASAGGGNWVFAANLAAGVVLTGLGIWDILAQDANGTAAEFGWFGPVAAAMGVVLVIASGWMLISRRKPAAEAETGADD